MNLKQKKDVLRLAGSFTSAETFDSVTSSSMGSSSSIGARGGAAMASGPITGVAVCASRVCPSMSSNEMTQIKDIHDPSSIPRLTKSALAAASWSRR